GIFHASVSRETFAPSGRTCPLHVEAQKKPRPKKSRGPKKEARLATMRKAGFRDGFQFRFPSFPFEIRDCGTWSVGFRTTEQAASDTFPKVIRPMLGMALGDRLVPQSSPCVVFGVFRLAVPVGLNLTSP